MRVARIWATASADAVNSAPRHLRHESDRPAILFRTLKLLSRLPWFLWHGLGAVAYFLAYYVIRHREQVIGEQLANALPDRTPAERKRIHQRFLRNFVDVFVELVKSLSLSAPQMRARVRVVNLEVATDYLKSGRSVMLVTSHMCNWEWLLQSVGMQLEFPVDAAYKPLHDAWAEKLMLRARQQFGARLVPAKELLGDFFKRRGVVRAVAMNADQAPMSTDQRYWTAFLHQDTAFYIGAEQIARGTRLPMIFCAMRRVRRHWYEVELQELWDGKESLAPNRVTERYARACEAEVLASPADWLWSYRRWRLKKPLYGND